MFENNQLKYEQLEKAVKKNWPDITDEEFSNTKGDLHEILILVSEKVHIPTDMVLKQIRHTINEHDLDLPFKETPSGVIDPKEPENKEWRARESQNDQRGS